MRLDFGCGLPSRSYLLLPMFYDTHAHLTRREFADDLPQVIARAEAAGIAKIISIGTDLASSERAVKLAEQYPNVFAAVGWHPSHALEAPDDIRPALRDLARHPKVVALGETGLDYYRLPSRQAGFTVADDERYKAKQAGLFRQHLEVAAELGLNCVDPSARLAGGHPGPVPAVRRTGCAPSFIASPTTPRPCSGLWRWDRW